jgi:hypothetical protein
MPPSGTPHKVRSHLIDEAEARGHEIRFFLVHVYRAVERDAAIGDLRFIFGVTHFAT